MKKTGELLKKVREEKGLSLHEIGLSLKINPKILKQIEDGDKNNLPAKTFLRGFVQSYANYLKLDSDEVLRIFSTEMGTTKPQQIPSGSTLDSKSTLMTISDPKPEDSPGKTSAPNYSKSEFEFKNFGIGILVLLLLLSLIGVRKVVEKYQRESEVDFSKNIKETAIPIGTAITNSNPIPTSDINSTKPEDLQALDSEKSNPLIEPPETTLPINDSVKIKTPIAATGTSSVPPVTTLAATTKPVVNHPDPTTTLVPTTTLGPSVKAATTNPMPTTTQPLLTAPVTTLAIKTAPVVKPLAPKEELKKPKNVEIVIEALDSVDVEVTLASGKSEVIKLSPSQTQTIKTPTGIKLNFSNGGAVNLIVNGKDVGVPGDLGKPKKVSF